MVVLSVVAVMEVITTTILSVETRILSLETRILSLETQILSLETRILSVGATILFVKGKEEETCERKFIQWSTYKRNLVENQAQTKYPDQVIEQRTNDPKSFRTKKSKPICRSKLRERVFGDKCHYRHDVSNLHAHEEEERNV